MSSLYPDKQLFHKSFAIGSKNSSLEVYIHYNPFIVFPNGLSHEGLDLLDEVADFVRNSGNDAALLKHPRSNIVANLLDAKPLVTYM